MNRREQIVATAASLFAEHGFHGVSVGEIGAAVGISGPGLYKHFPAKDAILAEMLVAISEELLAVGRGRVAASTNPADALVALVEWHTDFALQNKALIIVQDRDWAALPVDARERVRSLQRAYVDLWAEQMRLLDPALAILEARARAHATFGLLNSTPHSAFLPGNRMRELLREMAFAALGAEHPGAAGGEAP